MEQQVILPEKGGNGGGQTSSMEAPRMGQPPELSKSTVQRGCLAPDGCISLVVISLSLLGQSGPGNDLQEQIITEIRNILDRVRV